VKELHLGSLMMLAMKVLGLPMYSQAAQVLMMAACALSVRRNWTELWYWQVSHLPCQCQLATTGRVKHHLKEAAREGKMSLEMLLSAMGFLEHWQLLRTQLLCS
jgi:hypothetical protein